VVAGFSLLQSGRLKPATTRETTFSTDVTDDVTLRPLCSTLRTRGVFHVPVRGYGTLRMHAISIARENHELMRRKIMKCAWTGNTMGIVCGM
jgi:hypothetical protein